MRPWDLDAWREIAQSYARNRVRTALTLISVGWGTFLLVVLLGAGDGVANGVRSEFRDQAVTSVWVYPGVAADGGAARFDAADVAAVRALPGVARASGRSVPWGDPVVGWRDRSGTFPVRAVEPDYAALEQLAPVRGRWLDRLDDGERVAVIGVGVRSALFGDEDPLGAWITFGSTAFRVVGVHADPGSPEDELRIYVPLATAQALRGGTDAVDSLVFDLAAGDARAAARTENEVRARIADRHGLDPDAGIRVRNNTLRLHKFERLFGLLDAFVWWIGIGTVSAGVVGVSNLLLVSVRERSAEIGLRKALGATPARIVSSIVAEALVLTGSSGAAGIAAGAALVGVARWLVPPSELLRDPAVHLGVAIGAAALLVACGAAAACMPAWRAATLRPAVALRGGP